MPKHSVCTSLFYLSFNLKALSNTFPSWPGKLINVSKDVSYLQEVGSLDSHDVLSLIEIVGINLLLSMLLILLIRLVYSHIEIYKRNINKILSRENIPPPFIFCGNTNFNLKLSRNKSSLYLFNR
jgi:hypothetical protein